MDSTKSQASFSFSKEFLAGLTVSFVAISLGAAFGVQSGRGALAGILSAGVIALIAAAFGGTRIQCSGPTAPMTAVLVTLVLAIDAKPGLLVDHPDVPAAQFINLTILLAGAMLVIAGLFRLGRFISLVPKVVISGFMNGIACLIWLGIFNQLWGQDEKALLGGGLTANLAIIVSTTLLCFLLPGLLRRINPRLASFLPATLVVIALVTAVAYLFSIDIERVELGSGIKGWDDFKNLVTTNAPTHWSTSLLLLSIPIAGQLAFLAYLDTLLTSLVVDQKVQAITKTKEKTAQNKELVAQGVANGVVAMLGGIPGAQATIRSVLILKEGATSRIAGILVGLFVIIEMLVFQDLIGAIPKAVFSGVLIKVGWDVFDTQPIRIYLRELRSGRVPSDSSSQSKPMVSHSNMFFILGTTLVTLFYNLNAAVLVFGALFYIVNALHPMHDLVDLDETEGMSDEA